MKAIIEKYYRLAILMDVVNQLEIEVLPLLKQLPKHYASNAIKYTRLLQKEVDKQLGFQNSELFGDIADELRIWLDETIVYKHQQNEQN
jgi:hypothetical protein